MSALLLAVWIAGLLGVLVWSIWLARRARLARGAQLVPRTVVALGAVAVALLGTLAAHVWGTDPATRGMARIADARPGASQETAGHAGQPVRPGQPGDAGSAADGRADEEEGPPRARLFLRYVQMRLATTATATADAGPGGASATRSGVIGYSPRAALRLPRSYGLDESRQGWDLLQVALDGPQGLAVAAIDSDDGAPEPTTTRVVVHAAPRPDTDAPAPEALARHGDALIAAHGCGGQSSGAMPSARLDGPGAIYAILCAGDGPRAALVLERDLAGAETGDVPVRVVPLVWRGRHWRPHHIQIGSGSLIQIGTMADALPGVTLWEVPAPAGRAELFYPPADILAPCAEWLSGRHGEGFFSLPLDPGATGPGADATAQGPAVPAVPAVDDSALCVLPFTPPFGLEVRRLLPDVPGVRGRSLWAAGLAITPALLALLALAAQARSGISTRRFARLLALGWLSALWAAMSVWRLLWAHRIDMLRDYESVGSRVLANQVAAVLAGAALAATCAAVWLMDRDATGPQPARSRTMARGLILAALAWLTWLLVGSAALRGDTAALPVTAGLLGHALMSLAVGTAPLWLPRAWRVVIALARQRLERPSGPAGSDGHPSGEAANAAGDGARPASQRPWGQTWGQVWRQVWAWPWSLAILALAAVAAVAVATALLAPRAVALKLGLAWLFPFALYAALRSAVTLSGPALQRGLITLAVAGGAMLALAGLDPGVTVVIALPGALVALLLASHDACFGEGALRQVHGYQRQLAPLVTAHAVLLGGVGLIVAVLCTNGLAAAAAGEPDASTARTITQGAMHLALFAAFLFVAAAGHAYLRRGLRPAVPWLAAAVLLAGVWLVRAPLVDRVLESSAQAAHRLAIVLDPGYALLHSENKFLAGLTAWRETVVPGAAPMATGAAAGGAASAHPVLDGQGYFGAQLIDPGVLLSIENDYFPVLVLRETGTVGILATALLAWLLTAGAAALASARFRHGSAAQRTRVLGAVLLAAVCLYQPLAALGALPLTGVAWPGFGLDSPSDQWVFLALALWLLVWEPHDALADDDDRARRQLESFDVELRGSRVFRRVRMAATVAAVLVALAGMLVLARSAAFALRRPNPVDAGGQAVAPFDGLVRAVDYAYHLQCPWPHRVAPAAPADASAAAEALVPGDLLGEPDAPGVIRFHDALRARWRDQRGLAVDALRRFLAGDDAACDGGAVQAGAWRFERSPEVPGECRMRWKLGWPEVELAVTRAPAPDAAGAGERGPDTVSDGEPGNDEDDEDSEGGNVGDELDDAGAVADDVPADRAPAHSARCSIELRTDVLRVLRFPARRPYRDARIRLVSRAMGAAALDRGELVSGHLAVRLRPGAGAIDVAHARAGLYAGHEVRISPELTIVTGDDGHAILRRAASPAAGATTATATAPDQAPAGAPGAEPESWLFVRDPPLARVRVLAAEEGTWKLMPPGIAEMTLDRLTLIVVGGPDARSLWLFRPPQPWTDAPGDADDAGAGPAVVDPLLADDITTVRGERRRHYLYGGLLPELGWVNPFHGRMSLGLDGWVRVATAEYERTPQPARHGPRVWLDDGREVPYCGTLAAATDAGAGANAAGTPPDPAPAPTSDARTGEASGLDRVCRRSALDGVLECRVSLQPELAVRLRHLTELVTLAPERFGGAGSAAPVHAGYVLLRGDTGEIVAQGELVPGRASTAYAPATPEIEQVLVRLREDRDPATGRRLPPAQRGEASAEKIDWGQPIALGSTMKPFLGRALELAAPDVAAALTLRGAPTASAECAARRGRGGSRAAVHALLGHCPPTDSLWNHHGSYDMAGFLSASVNWFQGAIGLLGTAVPGGAWGLGEDTAAAWDGQPGPDLSALTAGNVGSHAPDRALWTSYQGRRVISARGTVDLAALRRTPMWQQFEALLGRPLCLLGSKGRCRQAHAMRDLCAVRALPIDQPTRDLRHLVALGPSAFDFYPPLADPSRRMGPRVRTREYLQFLRGSGLHPLGSLAQSADAFNRLIYELAAAPAGTPGAPAGHRLAASWFPVPSSAHAPARDCRPGSASDGGVAGGLCDVLRTGTARGLRDLLDDPRFTFHGAKTGTIDSLADIVESSAACERFRTGHTVADRPATDAAQPYWLPCGARQSPPEVNDSLLLLSLTVHTPAGDVPLTLGLRFQRSGPGFATRVARHYLEVVHAYFAPGPPNASPSTSPDAPSDEAAGELAPALPGSLPE